MEVLQTALPQSAFDAAGIAYQTVAKVADIPRPGRMWISFGPIGSELINHFAVGVEKRQTRIPI
jgi:hypothetical protein